MIKLFKKKTGSNDQEEFILLHDKQVGFEEAQFPECLIEMKQDDDVDTDEEIFDNALKACSRDFNDTRLKLETLSLNTFINNCDIKNRVTRPELFDNKVDDSKDSEPFYKQIGHLKLVRVIGKGAFGKFIFIWNVILSA